MLVYCYCMMTNVTFSLPERTIRRLRKRAEESGGRKGAISQVVDEALTNYLDAMDSRRRKETFVAKRGDEVVAEADSLERLAEILRAKKIDWRKLLITTSAPPEPVVHLGFRVRPA